jgi:hypothetical protein
MHETTEKAYEAFVKASPVPLRKTTGPQGFSQDGDQLILVCDPGFPTMGNCQFYQTNAKLDATERKALIDKAEGLGLSLIPALNINLSALSRFGKKFRIRSNVGELIFTISPCGNVRVMNRYAQSLVWVHAGGEGSRVTINLFEAALFGQWKISVIYSSPKGVMLNLSRECDHGENLELQGAIKKNEEGDGLEATLYPVHSDHVFSLGPLEFGGEFGFKVEVTGEWAKWFDDGCELEEQYIAFSAFNTDSDVLDDANAIGHTHIISPKATVATAGLGMMISILWKWYVGLSVGEEIIVAPLVGAAAV